MRTHLLAAALALVLAQAMSWPAMAAAGGNGNGNGHAYGYGQGGPLPLIGLSALGQAGAAAGGAFLVWRRRRTGRKSQKQ